MLSALDYSDVSIFKYEHWSNQLRLLIQRVCTSHLSPRYEARRNAKSGWTIHEAGMAQLDDDVCLVMQKLKDMGIDDNTIVVFTTDNGTELFTWPDGGITPFAQSKGTVLEPGFACPALYAGQARCRPAKLRTELFPGSTGSRLFWPLPEIPTSPTS